MIRMHGFPRCVCGHRQYKIILQNKWIDKVEELNFWIIKCVNCNLVRTFPVPSNTMDDLEDIKYRVKNQKLWRSFSLDLLKLIKAYKKDAYIKLLDVGCNVGIFVKLANEYGLNAIGVDIDQYAVKFGRGKFRVDLRCQNIRETRFDQNEFDVVVLSHTLEHIPKPIKLLEEINRILKPGGILVIETPNIEGLPVKLQKLRGELWYGYNPRQHVWHFSPKTIRHVVESTKFELVELKTKRSMYYEKTGNFWDFPRDMLLTLSGLLGFSDQIILVATPQK